METFVIAAIITIAVGLGTMFYAVLRRYKEENHYLSRLLTDSELRVIRREREALVWGVNGYRELDRANRVIEMLLDKGPEHQSKQDLHYITTISRDKNNPDVRYTVYTRKDALCSREQSSSQPEPDQVSQSEQYPAHSLSSASS